MSNGVGQVGMVLLVSAGIHFWYPDGLINSVWYGAKYRVSTDRVHTDRQPNDCEFLSAPIGLKGCSYSAYAIAFNDVNFRVRGEGAPKYRPDPVHPGKTFASYDDGKTWEWTNELNDPKVARVNVYWRKE